MERICLLYTGLFHGHSSQCNYTCVSQTKSLKPNTSQQINEKLSEVANPTSDVPLLSLSVTNEEAAATI